MARYQVVVGNIGTVFDGNDAGSALDNYKDYVNMSERGEGRAAGEHVALIVDGEVADENECPEE